MEFLKLFLMVIGAGALFILTWSALYAIYDWLCGVIGGLKWEYKYKHRFDKQPTAECYCKDCMYYNLDNNYCSDSHTKDNYALRDSHFCAFAVPRKHDPEKEKKK